jgi:hypothetical protein
MSQSLVTPASATAPPVHDNGPPAAALLSPAAPTAPAGKTPAPVPDPRQVAAAADSAGDQVLVGKQADFGGAVSVAADIGVASDPAAKSGGTSVAPSELVRRLEAAQHDAQLDLTGRLGTIGFRGVINPSRLGTPALIAAATSAWSGGVDAIRGYRARIARVEKAYEDSVLTAQRSQRWSPAEMRAWATRQSLSEPNESSQLLDLMFSQVSEGLEILAALPGDYTIKGDHIAFKNTASATRYASIRGWVEQRQTNWAGTPEGARPYTVSATLRALGDGFPAVE